MDNLRIILRSLRQVIGQEPSLIVMNYPTFHENEGKPTYYGVPVILDMKSKTDVIFYLFDDKRVLKPILYASVE